MNPTYVKLDEMRIAGISVRTTNQSESEGNGQIGELWRRFYQEGVQERIFDRVDPDVTWGVYSGYESDEKGAYDLLIGCAVNTESIISEGLTVRSIPAGAYAVFTTRRGPVAEVVTEAWGHVWEWSRQNGNKRAFTADLERYDPKMGADPNDTVVELYIALLED